MSIITVDNFDAKNVILSVENKKLVYSNDSYQFKKLYPKYKYPNGAEEDIYIQVPEVFSYGLKSFSNPTGETAHSFSFSINVKPNAEENISPEDAEITTKKLIEIFIDIEDNIKQFLKNSNTMKKLGKKNISGWEAFVENIKPVFNYQTDKETGERIEGAQPTLFVKLKTEIGKKNPAVKTIFHIYNPRIQRIEEVAPQDAIAKLQNKRCTATGVVHIESIFVPKTNNISIQYRLHEVLITEISKTDVSRLKFPSRLNKNVTGIKNLDLSESSEEEEEDSDQE